MEFNAPDAMRRRKSNKKGYHLSIMVCGRSGTGKSTFINSLCETDNEKALVYGDDDLKSGPQPTMAINSKRCTVEQPGSDKTVIHLTVTDTPGFGDAVDNSACSEMLIRYVEDKFSLILAEENKVDRNPKKDDDRVHVCLYFIVPTARGLRELDIDLMTKLSRCVNVIPVISKCDTLTQEEIRINKEAIMQDIYKHHIQIYDFPDDKDDTDLDARQESLTLRNSLPFCVMGSNSVERMPDGRYRRTRTYPWRSVAVDDVQSSDFLMLQNVLFASHILELRERTNEVLYENYRRSELEKKPEFRIGAHRTTGELPSAPPARATSQQLAHYVPYGVPHGLAPPPPPQTTPLSHQIESGPSNSTNGGNGVAVGYDNRYPIVGGVAGQHF